MSNLITLEVTALTGAKRLVYVPAPLFWARFSALWSSPATLFVEVVR